MPLNQKVLSNPKENVTKLILYIYSMQSFVFSGMNSVTRNKDISKIDIYGPFASALGFIVHAANQNLSRNQRLPYKIEVFRGMVRKESDLKDFFPKNKVELKGFTSTSLDRDQAMTFTHKESDEHDLVSVLLKIIFIGRK